MEVGGEGGRGSRGTKVERRGHSLATKGTEKTGDARGRWAERRVSPVEDRSLKLEVGLKAEAEVEGRRNAGR